MLDTIFFCSFVFSSVDIGIQFGGRVVGVYFFFAGDSILCVECVFCFCMGRGLYMRIHGRKIREVLDWLVGCEFARYPHLYTACDQMDMIE